MSVEHRLQICALGPHVLVLALAGVRWQAYLADLLIISVCQLGVAVLLGKGDVLAQHFLAEHAWVRRRLFLGCSLLSFLHAKHKQS